MGKILENINACLLLCHDKHVAEGISVRVINVLYRVRVHQTKYFPGVGLSRLET